MTTLSLLVAAIILYLCSSVYQSDILGWMISIVSLSIVITTFATVKRFVQGLGIVFLITGGLLLMTHGESWLDFLHSFGNMLNILTFFALIPLIALPIELGHYAVRVQAMIQSKINSSALLYSITSLLSYVLSSFMNLATLPMMYHSIRPSLELYPIEQKERFISRAITHGYSMPILWTPVASIVGIVVEMTGIEWGSVLPVLIPFSIFGLVLDWMIGLWIANRRQQQMNPAVMREVTAARAQALDSDRQHFGSLKTSNPVQILFAIVIFNLIIFILETYTSFSFLLLVSIVVIPFAFIWSCLLRNGGQFFKKAKTMFPQHLLKMREQFFVFLCAGFLISSIQTTGAGHTINAGILAVKEYVGGDIFLILIPLIPLALGFIGLHPAVGLALTAESLNPQTLGISPQLTAIAMLTGAAPAFLMGPYNATAGLMSNLTGQSSYRVSNWNAPFTGVYMLTVMILLISMKKMG